MSQIIGRITNVYKQASKSEMSADVLAGVSVLPVYDAYPFEPSGGSLVINGATLSYASVDLESNMITLSSPLGVGATQDDEVAVFPAGETVWAMVDSQDGDEGVRAMVPYGLKDRLATGIRDEEDQESVIVGDATGRWQVDALDDEIVIIQGTTFRTGDEGQARLEITDDQTVFSFLRFYSDSSLATTYSEIQGSAANIGIYANPALTGVDGASIFLAGEDGSFTLDASITMSADDLFLNFDGAPGHGVWFGAGGLAGTPLRRLAFGTFAATTDFQGEDVLTHNLQATPVWTMIFSMTGNYLSFRVMSQNSTTTTFRVWNNQTGALHAGVGPFTVGWLAMY